MKKQKFRIIYGIFVCHLPEEFHQLIFSGSSETVHYSAVCPPMPKQSNEQL